jgi:hypothetical protein
LCLAKLTLSAYPVLFPLPAVFAAESSGMESRGKGERGNNYELEITNYEKNLYVLRFTLNF